MIKYMKIGLVTFFDDNFGTCLQAYALFNTIQNLGYDVELIKYHRNNRTVATESRWKKIFRYNPKTVLNYFANRKRIEEVRSSFDNFRNNHFVFSSKSYFRDSDLSELAKEYDLFICGSDMIWSEDFYDDWKYLYLAFAEKSRSLTYAPSFGKNKIKPEHINECQEYLNGIGCLSCREQAGVELLRNQFKLEATRVLDPTLLMSADDWNAIINNNDRLVQEKYNLAYCFLGTTHGREKVFSQVAHINDKKFVILTGFDGVFKKYKYKQGCGPLEFVRLYRDSEFVVTDTFHGMLFAIIFRKPFVVLAKEPFGVSADRLKSTLSLLGLDDRYVNYDVNIEDYLTIDYSKADAIINENKQTSLSFLYNIIKLAYVK